SSCVARQRNQRTCTSSTEMLKAIHARASASPWRGRAFDDGVDQISDRSNRLDVPFVHTDVERFLDIPNQLEDLYGLETQIPDEPGTVREARIAPRGAADQVDRTGANRSACGAFAQRIR